MGIVCSNIRQENRKLKIDHSFSGNNGIKNINTSINSSTYSYKSYCQPQNNVIKKNAENIKLNYDNENQFNKLYDKLIKKHNKYRQMYGAQNLDLNIDLCEIAQKYAEKSASFNSIDHCCDLYKNEIIGMNIEIVDSINFNIDSICDKWYNEKNKYDFVSNKYQSDTSHFTQLIWRDTKFVGFGYANNSSGKIYFVAIYYPPGNIFSKFKENVKKSI